MHGLMMVLFILMRRIRTCYCVHYGESRPSIKYGRALFLTKKNNNICDEIIYNLSVS